MEQHNVSVPGFSGTVIESGINGPAAPAQSGPPAYVSDTTGMGKSQIAAMQFVDAARADLARDPNNVWLAKQNRQALGHALHGEAAPAWLPKSEAASAEAEKLGARVVNEGDIPELEASFAPITEQDTGRLITRAVVVSNVPREVATEAVQFCMDAQLPRAVSEAVLDRLGKHATFGHGLDSELSQEDAQTLQLDCARRLGGDEKAEAAASLARKYLHSVGGDALLANVDKRAGSLAFDPGLILQLAMMARVRGLDK